MIEFIEGPCGWNKMAPTLLRHQEFGGISTWIGYSTAQFLDGSDPHIIHTTRFSDLQSDSGVRIELLPEPLTKSWRESGLRFATNSYMREIGFQEVLEQSLDLIRRVPPLFGTVAGLCHSIHALVTSDTNFDSSYSDPHLPFSIFVSCPQATEVNRVERMAECIVHEALHLQLSLMETTAPVIVDTPEKSLLFSPWKNEFRTVHGLVHGVYVFGNLRHFWKCIAAHATEYSSFAEARIEEIDIELATAKGLGSSPALTPMGQRLARSLIGAS